MKKMKSLKQQMTTALSLTLAVLAIAACAPEQALAKGKGRAGASANFSNRRGGSGDNYTGAAANVRQRNNAQRLLGRGDGSFQQRNNAPQRGAIAPLWDDEFVSGHSKQKSDLLAGTYGRGSFAKSRGKQGR